MVRRLAVAAALVVSTSCQDPNAPVLGLHIETSASVVSLAQDNAISVMLTNTSQQVVYAAITGTYLVFDRRVGNTWDDGHDWFVTDGFGKSWPVNPGRTLSESLPLGYLDNKPGEYRFRFLLFSDAELTRPLSESDRISSSFIVTP